MNLVKLQRHIPAGGINPNLNLKYINLESVLSNTFQMYINNEVKIPVVSKYAVSKTNICGSFNLTDILGFVHCISENDVTVDFINEEFALIYKDYHVAFALLGDTKPEGFLVDKITAVYLVEPNIDSKVIIEG